jgi:hypothetical protein
VRAARIASLHGASRHREGFRYTVEYEAVPEIPNMRPNTLVTAA